MTFGDPSWAPVPEDAGGFLYILLGGREPAPGPPYTHTFTPPQQPVFTTSGNLLYRPPPPGPAYTLSEASP